MTKYSQAFKQQVIDSYFQHNNELAHTCRHFNLAKKVVRCWIRLLHYAGKEGLKVRQTRQIYSPEFKFQVLEPILRGDCTAERWLTLVCLIQGLSANG